VALARQLKRLTGETLGRIYSFFAMHVAYGIRNLNVTAIPVATFPEKKIKALIAAHNARPLGHSSHKHRSIYVLFALLYCY